MSNSRVSSTSSRRVGAKVVLEHVGGLEQQIDALVRQELSDGEHHRSVDSRPRQLAGWHCRRRPGLMPTGSTVTSPYPTCRSSSALNEESATAATTRGRRMSRRAGPAGACARPGDPSELKNSLGVRLWYTSTSGSLVDSSTRVTSGSPMLDR